MSNVKNNHEQLKATQFGSDRANPRYTELPGTNAPWSIRNSLRYLAAQQADPRDKEAMHNLITEDGKRKPTVAMTIAAALMARASSGHVKAAGCVMDNIEGKLAQGYKDETERPPLEKPEFHIHIRGKEEIILPDTATQGGLTACG